MKPETDALDRREKTILRMRNGTFVDKSGKQQPRMNGLSIGDFLIQRQREITEHLVADFADTFPALASQIKAALEEIERERGYSPLG